jgi:hypothetical protein
MKDIYKLALLFTVLAASIIPLAYFLFNESYAIDFISQLLWGRAHLHIDVSKNTFMIVSHIVLGIWSTSLSTMIVVISSAFVFCISLILIVLVEEPAITKRIVHLKSAFHL